VGATLAARGHFDAYKDFGMNVIEGVEEPGVTDEASIRQNGMWTRIRATGARASMSSAAGSRG
jgi:hypothetical protein